MILIGLGANLPSNYGSPEDTLEAALRRFSAYGLNVVRRSRLWLSAPVPVSDQPWYCNAVAAVEASQSAPEVMQALQAIEQDFGRVRSVKDAPRVLDLDLLAYHDEISEAAALQLPHPRMQVRGFVLYPLQEIAPDWIHPVLDVSVTELIKNLPTGQSIKPLKAEVA